jgi:hypothetical protein
MPRCVVMASFEARQALNDGSAFVIASLRAKIVPISGNARGQRTMFVRSKLLLKD